MGLGFLYGMPELEMALETLGGFQHDVRICGDCPKLQGDCERIETKESLGSLYIPLPTGQFQVSAFDRENPIKHEHNKNCSE